MVPFDASALLAMLLAFYPVVGPGALARARAERPEYFAGGEIGGREGDKLYLPDSRIFDLIFEVNTPGQRWQVLELTGGGGGGEPADPFALEDGPLLPIDETALALDPLPPIFEDFVTGRTGELTPQLVRLGLAHALASTLPPRAELAVAFDEIDEAASGAADTGLALDDVRPWELLDTTNDHANAAGFEQGTFTDPPPDDPGPLPPPPPPPPENQEPS